MPRLGLPGQSKVKPELFLANSGQGCQVPALAPYSTASLLWVGEGSHLPTLSCPLSPQAQGTAESSVTRHYIFKVFNFSK